jgi:hypothetical protein
MRVVYLSDIKKAEERKALHPYRRRFHDFVKAPANVVAARDARTREHRTVTAVLMGDPPPGRSALDRRGG